MTATERSDSSSGQWLLLLLLAAWLALVPPAVVALLSAALDQPPELLVSMGLVMPGDPVLPAWAFGLLATLLSLGLQLLAFGPAYLATRRRDRRFLRTAASLLLAISLYQALNALAALTWPVDAITTFGPGTVERMLTAALRLATVLPLLLFGLGWLDARRDFAGLRTAWRRAGLRLWLDPSALWLALGTAAVIVWPWVVVGSLGSSGTVAANSLQALPQALGEEILFRGFAFAWLWRAVRGRRAAAIASLILFVAAQGGTVLPLGDWGALPRFLLALPLGLLATELTVRAGGSIWPAFIVHYLYDWFHIAFVDPRSREEIFHWLAQAWAVLAVVAMGLLLWLGRKALGAVRESPVSDKSTAGLATSAAFAGLAWLAILGLYLGLGRPGLHPDGFTITLIEQADLRPAAAIEDPAERRAWVYRTLVETAERSQPPLRAELERRGVAYRAHYLINMIEVLERPGLRRTFAWEPGVASVLFQPGVRRYAYPFKLPDMDLGGPTGVEWNVAAVGADRVWELGYTGQGIVVGDADTGVQWDHPALKDAYLGWDGAVANHDYHWYDPWDASREPGDDHGHGTHTTGIVVGQDGENRVGLAPGARWIACRNMRHGLGNPGSYLSCMEFLLAPFPLGGDPLRDGDPARGADVVNNSWGCPLQEGCRIDTLRLAVDHLRAAGQMMVVSAGNSGPVCSTVEDVPAPYDAAFTVGATEGIDEAASFSSRGPVTVDGSRRLKPDIVAPGVNIRSSVPGGYASLPGTSMAGPHVAGAVALLWSVEPGLVGDVAGTEALLIATARPLTVEATCPRGPEMGVVCACGDDGPGSVPNNVYGWGQVDVWAAVQRLLGNGP